MRASMMAVLLATALWLPGICAAGQSQAGSKCEARFDGLDKNHDGKLTLEEFQAGAINPAKVRQRFGSVDTAGRGYVLKDEVCSGKLR